MNSATTIQIYLISGPWKKEDGFQVATAKVLDALMDEGKLAYYAYSPNVYRRPLQRNRVAAMRAGSLGKKMGVKAGVFDLIIHSHKIAIELKQPKGRLSPEQKSWRDTAESWGWKCYVEKTTKGIIEVLIENGIIDRRRL